MTKDPLKIAMAAALAVFLTCTTVLIAMTVSMRNRLSASAGAGGAAGSPHSASPAEPDANLADLAIPPFTLVDQDGRPANNDVFKGRVTIADFMFTNCPLICPQMTGVMADLSDRLKNAPGVRFLSFTVDPKRDTPAHLREYAKQFEADTARWRFLTDPAGNRATTWRIVRDGLKFAIKDGDAVTLADGTSAANIVHPPHLVLIGPGGEVLGIYYHGNEQEVKALETRARAVAALLGK